MDIQWHDLMRSPLRELRLGGSILFQNGESCALDGERLLALSIDEGADSALLPGNVLSASCRADLVNDAGQWNPGGSLRGANELIGATLMPRLGILDGDGMLWRDLGVFQVESAVQLEGENILRLNAQDSIAFELGAAFADELSYPQSLSGLWNYALAQSRYIWQGSVPNGGALIHTRPDFKGASLRTVLGWIAAAAGCFVRLDREGSLQLVPLWDASADVFEIDGAAYLSLQGDEKSYGPVDALRLILPEDAQKTYLSGAGLHTLQIAGNPLYIPEDAGLDALARGTLNCVSGFATEKLQLHWRGDPDLQIGARICVTDLSGRRHSGVLSRQSLRFEGGFSASCSCDVPDEGAAGVQRIFAPEGGVNASALTGAVDGALLKVGSVTTEKLAAGSVTAEKIAAGVISADTIKAGALEALTAKIESLTAADISTDRLAAAMAAFTVLAAGTASFDRATVQHLVAQALNLSFGTAGEVFIENLRVVYAQMVQAAIGSLCIKASDGNYYAIDVDANGHVTASRVSVSEGEIIAGQTDAGRVILETSITAGSLNTSNLLATYALVNRIDAARIDVDQLFAREAFISALITTDISSNSYIQQAIRDSAGEVSKFVRLDSSGLHVGDPSAASEVLIDEGSVNVVIGGLDYSRFAADYVQFGSYQMRRTADGGMAFQFRRN